MRNQIKLPACITPTHFNEIDRRQARSPYELSDCWDGEVELTLPASWMVSILSYYLLTRGVDGNLKSDSWQESY